MIAIDDGGSMTYHRNINATCTENLLMDKFSGWKFDINKPIEELEVGTIAQELVILKIIHSQISCVQNTHCDFQYGVDPIPVSDDSVEFSLHLNLLGEPQTMSGPMEIGETIAVQCKDFGKVYMRLRIKLINFYFIRLHI